MSSFTSFGRSIDLRMNPARWLSALFFVAALAGIAVLLVTDATRGYTFQPIHTRIAAFPLLFIGLSYMCLMLSARRSRVELIKGLLLGLAFVLWGSEQLLPPTKLVTIMDGAVVTIFVVDLSLVIAEHFRVNDHDLP